MELLEAINSEERQHRLGFRFLEIVFCSGALKSGPVELVFRLLRRRHLPNGV